MNPLIMIGVFIVATGIGYMLINKVPSLLHTPLMSGMNALSGITILGAVGATAAAILTQQQNPVLGGILGGLAIILAMINVVGGFLVTHRMLMMFTKKKEKNNE